jgi:hypothetical protein
MNDPHAISEPLHKRIELALTKVPYAHWQRHLMPAALVIELLELTAALLRRSGQQGDADVLDDIRRSFLAGRDPGPLQGTAVEAPSPRPTSGALPRRRLPGFSERL